MEQAQTQQKEAQKPGGDSKRIRRKAFIKTLPVMCSYLFIGLAYGMLMENAGFAWYYSLFTSFTVYTGASVRPGDLPVERSESDHRSSDRIFDEQQTDLLQPVLY